MGDDTLGMTYEMRRQSRGAEPPKEGRPWRRRLIRAGIAILCIAAVVSAYFIWRSIAYVRTARAEVRAEFIKVSTRVDAPMLERHVRTGDQVTEGQELARLDDSDFREALNAAEARATARESAHEQAKAHEVLVEEEVRLDVELAEAELERADAAVASAEASLRLRQARLEGEIAQADAEAKHARALLDRTRKGARAEEIQAAEANLASARALQKLYELEVRQSQQLVGEGIDSAHVLEVKKTQLETQKNAVRRAELELKMLRDGPTAEEIEAQAQTLASRQAAHELAKAGTGEVERLKADLRIRKAELGQAQARLEEMRATSPERLNLVAQALKAAEAELNAARADVRTRRTELGYTILRSSVTGTVMRTFDEEGEFCRRGATTMLVTDDSKGRWIQGLIRERDSRHVKVGQAAKVRIGTDSRKYYRAEVTAVGGATFSATSSRTESAEESAQWGMPGQVVVLLELLEEPEHTLLPGTSARAIIRVW